MSPLSNTQVADTESAESHWRELYRIGGLACLLVAALVIFAIGAFFIWPYKPGFVSVAEVFAVLQNDRLGGLISLDLPMLMIMLINILPLLALYVALKQVSETWALIALVAGLMAVALLIPTRPMVELVALSEKYAAATTETERSQTLAAGEALLTLFNGTAWVVQTGLLVWSDLLSSWLMLRTRRFGKATAYVGIVMGLLGSGFFLPGIGIFLLFLNTIAGVLWYGLLARDFFRLGWGPAVNRVTGAGQRVG